MSLSTVAAVGRFLAQLEVNAERLPISWHSGEPLTVSPEFYSAAFETLRDTPGCPALQHQMQTNGTLIDDRWCDLFVAWDVQVGLSIDGPQWIHDVCRLDRQGRGSFDRAARGVRKLVDHGIRPSVIAVLSETSLQHPDAVWTALTELGFGMIAFNVVELEGANALRQRDFSATVCRAYEDFLCRIAELRADRPEVGVRELDETRRFLKLPAGQDVHSIENIPGAIVSISAAGGVSTFSPELMDLQHDKYGHFIFGNVHEHSWSQIRSNPHFASIAASVALGVERCRQRCAFFELCGGGAPSNKLGEHNTVEATETLDCRIRVQAVTEAYLRTIGV